MRKFEVVSKVFGEGVLSLQGEDWEFRGTTGLVLGGPWRILSAECPADWHKDQAGMGMEDREDNPSFLIPPGKWLTIVTDIGEVLGFEIVRDIQ
jgi:hypothetical protein